MSKIDFEELAQYYSYCNQEAESTVTRLRELLKRMPEWVYDKDQECYFCEICGNNRDYGHASDCELAKELADDND